MQIKRQTLHFNDLLTIIFPINKIKWNHLDLTETRRSFGLKLRNIER